MDNYTDKTYDGSGSNWVNASEGVAWTAKGGDYHSSPTYTVDFGNKGTQDLELDVSDIVEQWVAGTKAKYGFGVRLSASFESYYSSEC